MAQQTSRREKSLLMSRALEKAAKYVCNTKCGVCPMLVEDFSCPTSCGLETVPWKCWQAFFIDQVQGRNKASEEQSKAA